MSVAVGSSRRDRAARGAAATKTSARGAGDWGRRAPLLPALIFTIILTQLPFVATLVISMLDWNAYSPDERRFDGLPTFRRVFTDVNVAALVVVTIELT